jgi:hypothetical protein
MSKKKKNKTKIKIAPPLNISLPKKKNYRFLALPSHLSFFLCSLPFVFYLTKKQWRQKNLCSRSPKKKNSTPFFFFSKRRSFKEWAIANCRLRRSSKKKVFLTKHIEVQK